METSAVCMEKISDRMRDTFIMAIGKFNMKERAGQISLLKCRCEEGDLLDKAILCGEKIASG